MEGHTPDAVQQNHAGILMEFQQRLIFCCHKYGVLCMMMVFTPMTAKKCNVFYQKSCQPRTVSQIVGRTTRAYELRFLYHHDGITNARVSIPGCMKIHVRQCKVVFNIDFQ
jgi:hypothetical protein